MVSRIIIDGRKRYQRGWVIPIPEYINNDRFLKLVWNRKMLTIAISGIAMFKQQSRYNHVLVVVLGLLLTSCGSGDDSTRFDSVETVSSTGPVVQGSLQSEVPALGAALSAEQSANSIANAQVFVPTTTPEAVVETSVEITQAPTESVIPTSSEEVAQPSEVAQPVAQPVAQSVAQVQLEFVEVVVADTTTTTARVNWTLSKVATGRIEYGVTAAYGNFTQEEDSFNFSEHTQTISGLAPNTEYHFRLVAVDAEGNEAVSGDYIFSTSALEIGQASNQIPTGNWVEAAAADSYDESVPMAGMFVGNPNAGVYGAANTSNANHHSLRFRAPRTGIISSVLFQNRLSAVASVFSRAANQPKYQACQDYWASQGQPFVNEETIEQLEKAAKCAFHTGNYYSAGNGGSLIFEIRPDLDGIPDMDVAPLGKTNTPFVPLYNTPQRMFNHQLDTVANVTAGAFYHIVVRNMTPVVGQRSNLTVEEAFARPLTTGALAINGIQFPKGADVAGQQGPFFAGHKTLRSYDQNTNPRDWVEDPDTIGWWGATYSTGEFIGQTAPMFDSLVVDRITGRSGSMYIQGNRYARQIITATHDTTVDGVWVQHGHSANANGQPMEVELKEGNTTLATASFPHNAEVRAMVAGAGSDLWEQTAMTWSYQALSVEVNLIEGQTYFIEFSAPSGAGFRLFSVANKSSYGVPTEYMGQQPGEEAQRSENSGATWGQFPGSGSPYPTGRALQTVLTVRGMPRELVE